MIALKDALKLNPRLNPKLFLPSQEDVLRALDESPVKEWLDFIAKEHIAPQRRWLVFVPCTARKPYDPPRDELHRRFIELEKRYDIYLVSVSEPLALEPREYWNFSWRNQNLIYDAPFFPWMEKYGYPWKDEIAVKVWRRLSDVASSWYERNKKFKAVVCYATPKSGYRKIVRHIDVDVFVPNTEPEIELSYEENTDKIYTHPQPWRQLIEILNNLN
jgi:predicted RNA-binding protein